MSYDDDEAAAAVRRTAVTALSPDVMEDDLLQESATPPSPPMQPASGLAAAAAAAAARMAAAHQAQQQQRSAAAAAAAAAGSSSGVLAAPVPIRRAAAAGTPHASAFENEGGGRSNSPPPLPELLSQSVPAQGRLLQRGGVMNSSSHNLLETLGGDFALHEGGGGGSSGQLSRQSSSGSHHHSHSHLHPHRSNRPAGTAPTSRTGSAGHPGDELFGNHNSNNPAAAAAVSSSDTFPQQPQHSPQLQHSHTYDSLKQQQQQQQQSRSTAAIPIHPSQHYSPAFHAGGGRARAASVSQQPQQHLHVSSHGVYTPSALAAAANSSHSFGGGQHSPVLQAHGDSASPPTSALLSAHARNAAHSRQASGAAAQQQQQPGSGFDSTTNATTTPSRTPLPPFQPSQQQQPPARETRSHSLIEHGGKRSLLDQATVASGGAGRPGAAAADFTQRDRDRERDLDKEASVVPGSWSGSGVTHISLPSNLAAANAAESLRVTRGRSQSYAVPPSSALTARAQAAAAAAAAERDAQQANPSRLLASSPLVPSSCKAALVRVEEYVREVSRTVDEYKNLLVRLRSRRRQVLGTLAESMRRLASWMQVDKLAVLQELQTLQSDLFEREESMLTMACVLLKERGASVAAGLEDAQAQMVHALHQFADAHGGGRGIEFLTQPSTAPASEVKKLQAALSLLPSRLFLESLIVSPKQYALTHAQLVPHSAEHRALAVRLDACKTRYLAVAKATDLEELADRRQRMQRVLAAMEQRAAEQARRNAPPPPPAPQPVMHEDAAAAAAATLSLAAAAAATAAAADSAPMTPSSSSPLLDHTPARDIELEFGKLVLDERAKEGRAVAKFLADLEGLVDGIKEGGEDAVNTHATTASVTATAPTTPQSNEVVRASAGSHSSESDLVRATGDLSLNGAPSNGPIGVAVRARPSLAEVSQRCYNLISSFLSQLEHSCARDYAVPPSQRPVLRLLVQRALFPRLWHLLLVLGYEEEDLRMLPPLTAAPAPGTTNGGSGDEQDEDDDSDVEDEEGWPSNDSQANLPTMAAREQLTESQLAWLRLVSPLDLGIPANFCRPPPPAPAPVPSPSPAAAAGSGLTSPRGSIISTTPGTPGRAPPNYKPAAPPVSAMASPTSAVASSSATAAASAPPPVPFYLKSSYRAVSDLLEELGQLFSPLDMLSALLAASKRIYVDAKNYTETHAARKAAATSNAKAPKTEALGADSFFPIFLYALAQSSVPAWLHRLKAMQRFALTMDGSDGSDACMAEPCYYLTTLEAALQFVLQATPDTLNPNSDNKKQKQKQEKQLRKRRSSSSSSNNSSSGSHGPDNKREESKAAPGPSPPVAAKPVAAADPSSRSSGTPAAPAQLNVPQPPVPASTATATVPAQPAPAPIPAPAPVVARSIEAEQQQQQQPPQQQQQQPQLHQQQQQQQQRWQESRASVHGSPFQDAAASHPIFSGRHASYEEMREFDANDL